MDLLKHKPSIQSLLSDVGEDPNRDGLLKTPERFLKAFSSLTSGYTEDIDKIINKAMFEVNYHDMVIVKDIEFYSLCEHHLLPFFGICHVGYIPRNKVIGLSKIPRIVNVFAKRLQIQEKLTHQIAETIQEKINPLGVGVVIHAQHLCMKMRGIEKQSSYAISSSMQGCFRDDLQTRTEFMDHVRSKNY